MGSQTPTRLYNHAEKLRRDGMLNVLRPHCFFNTCERLFFFFPAVRGSLSLAPWLSGSLMRDERLAEAHAAPVTFHHRGCTRLILPPPPLPRNPLNLCLQRLPQNARLLYVKNPSTSLESKLRTFGAHRGKYSTTRQCKNGAQR